ncbi:hypothetical protein DM01DRAFT_1304978 [Hesseltinella vesiculosa]|uniref:Uncharacterized protein n=1 Tax=Hesseltinella vesiculosa TaxID=101127 RepID=A0A1X2GI83_9FUNG|nr:hypothetical protein DM01DRAFT_1304978 [Hesseltinella vesiculosa]
MTSSLSKIPTPQGGASLMVAYQCQEKDMVVVGTNAIAAHRVFALLEANAKVILLGDPSAMTPELVHRIESNSITWSGASWSSFVAAQHGQTHMAFVCQDLPDASVDTIAQDCQRLRIPVNVTDRNDLCDFFMTSTYRDQSLQIAVSTNGQASKLSNRIRRHIIGGLPARLGLAVQRVGQLRQRIRKSDPSDQAKQRRMAWLAQICEYWSMDRLAKLSDKEMEDLLESYQHKDEGYSSTMDDEDLVSAGRKEGEPAALLQGSITLVGSGTGDPKLLTLAAHEAIKKADLVLSDKIVPAEVVALVECELKIARKFPGNADAAQQEFNELALQALKQGKNVVRLKQGDPFLFGRGGEEVLFFREHGFETKVLPGISSAIAAPLLAGIPLTHRSVTSQFLVTTGTGRKNSPVPLPIYEPTRTDVFLMAIHRLDALVDDLIQMKQYPADVPCAIVERASCDDQRVVYGPLSNISNVLESVGGSRPPGLLIVGHAINVLKEQNKLPVEGVVKDFLQEWQPDMHPSSLLQLHDPEGVY